ncbi:MAG: HAD family hydrolase [Actinomycetota bacterium]|nr:HAD family hydrolase [Actinomycetota bacterium]
MGSTEAVILDIDGTLVDSNYQHTIAWQRAFRDVGFTADAWRIHRCIGMGGDQIVTTLLGEETENEHGEAIREAEAHRYSSLIDEVVPFDGAHGLIAGLKERGLTVVLASSAKEEEVEHYVEILDAGALHDGYTSAADVDATKPDPDLIHAAITKAGGGDILMVGDSVWDIEAASRAGIDAIGVLCGGFGEAELSGAGAKAVVESIMDVSPEIQSGRPGSDHER